MWSAIKGAIFEADPGEAKAAPKAAAPTVTSASVPIGAAMDLGSTINPEFVGAIKKAVFGKATALTSLVEAAEKLANIIPDQATRYKAAYATAGNGRTVQQIAAAADIHMADVEGEELRFKAAIEARLGQEAVQLEHTAQAAQQQIVTTSSMIEQLQREIAEKQQRIGQLTQAQAEAAAAAANKRAEMQLVGDQFKAAAQAVRNEINILRQAVVNSLS